jgi:hypothetical protein
MINKIILVNHKEIIFFKIKLLINFLFNKLNRIQIYLMACSQ